jgi:hypothetical protein
MDITSVRRHGRDYSKHSKVVNGNGNGKHEGYFGGVHMTKSHDSITCTSKHNMHATHYKNRLSEARVWVAVRETRLVSAH